ncbi:MAG: hypothetical protein HYU77_16595 [Betaproteobacteria bacterium]|nr:hypothetical protein [Betaproteobacteria bacterium]
MKARLIFPYCFLVGSIGALAPAGAEELLDKDGAKYLGWQISKVEFRTCYKKVLQIEKGKILRTNDKCETSNGRLKASFSEFVEVKTVNPDARLITAISADKRERKIYYPEIAETVVNLKLSDLKSGDRITVVVPTSGRGDDIWRAEAITSPWFAYKPKE